MKLARADPRKRFGHFVLLSEVGKGGMGVVYRAWNERLRRVATLNNRGLAFSRKGDLDAAIADFTRAIESVPGHALAWSDRARSRCEKGDLEGALADVNKALELDPAYPTALYGRAEIRRRKHDRAGASADLERFLELAPGSSDAPRARELLLELKKEK
ncbi:tetratricopeptide repeat protein [bacterium]|nr:tetratricopeptide repeat protein [bacterium]